MIQYLVDFYGAGDTHPSDGHTDAFDTAEMAQAAGVEFLALRDSEPTIQWIDRFEIRAVDWNDQDDWSDAITDQTLVQFDDYEEEADSPHRWYQVTLGEMIAEMGFDADYRASLTAGLSDFGFWTLDGFSAPDMFIRLTLGV